MRRRMTASGGKRLRRRHARTGGFSVFVLGLGLGLGLGASGCGRGETIELVAIRGCGLDQEFSGLRVRVLGDFPASSGSEILLGPAQQGSIPELPEGATGVAAEGLFGTTTTAIGRSWGVDPQLVRGRLPGVADEASVLPVFFAAPDSLCEVDEQPTLRSEAGAAAHTSGDVLLVGGLDQTGAVLDELVHVDLFTGQTRTLSARLAQPRRGHSVHALDGRRFMILAGAGPELLASQRVIVDVSGPGSVTSVGPLELDGDELVFSDHAAASSPVDRRILLAGGCDVVDPQARCDPASALAGTYWFDPLAPQAMQPLPALTQPRYGADAAVSSDGVAWVAGGFGTNGLRLGSVERLRPGGEWTLVHDLAQAGGALGFALLDGGLVLLSDDAGVIHWWSEAGSGSLDATSRAPPLAAVSSDRPMLALPGERVFVDTWLFTPGTAAVDPTTGRVELLPIPRHGGQLLALHDGTMLVVGGWDTQTQELAAAPILRLRPRLDGPDEWTPELAGPQNDAFVSNAPGRATVIVGGLRLDASGGETDALPDVRAHVRGFRSRALRLEFSFESEPGTTAHVWLGQGSVTLVTLALVDDDLVVRQRGPDGSTKTLACGQAVGTLAGLLVLELGADGRELRLDAEDGVLASCELEWPSSAGVAVGFGVSGAEGARFFGLRLARR